MGLDGTVAPPRGQQFEQAAARVCGVLDNTDCSALAACVENVSEGWQWARKPNYFLGRLDDPLKGPPVSLRAARKPHKHVVADDALH